MQICQKNLAAPDGSVRSISGSVKRYPYHLLRTVIFRHTGKNVRIMVLHFYDRKSKFFRYHHGIVLWMHITADEFRLYFQKRFKPSDCFPKCFDCTQIFQISHIWRWIKTVIHTYAERILKLSTDGKHLSPIWCGNHERKWCITSGTTDHIWFILIKIHHGIVRPDANFSVMR